MVLHVFVVHVRRRRFRPCRESNRRAAHVGLCVSFSSLLSPPSQPPPAAHVGRSFQPSRRMAALASLYQLPLWLLLSISIIVEVRAQGPQSSQLSPGFQNLLPRPLIQFKLGPQGEIVTSTRNWKSKQWHRLYTSNSSAVDSGADPAAPVVGVNGTTLPAYDTIVRPLPPLRTFFPTIAATLHFTPRRSGGKT